MDLRPQWIVAPRWMTDFIRDYTPPFEAVANRRWLFETFGLNSRGKGGLAHIGTKT